MGSCSEAFRTVALQPVQARKLDLGVPDVPLSGDAAGTEMNGDD